MDTVGYGSVSLLASGFITHGSTAAYHRVGLRSAEINYGASRHELMPVIKPIACSHHYSEKKKQPNKTTTKPQTNPQDFACENFTKNYKRKYRTKKFHFLTFFFFSLVSFNSVSSLEVFLR